MAGIIVFNLNYRQFEGVDQTGKNGIAADMTYSVQNMVDVLIAAGKVDGRIGGVVGDAADAYDFGQFAGKLQVISPTMQIPLQRPANAAFHELQDASSAAIKNKAAGHLSVVDGVHISLSCGKPHLSVYVHDLKGAAVGHKIHVCVAAQGKAWTFDSVHK